jgi:hypothetical protein
VRKLIIAHHWAGYPKSQKKKMNTQGQTYIIQLNAFMAEYWKTTTFYIRSAFLADYDDKKEGREYEGFPAAIVATTGPPQNLFKYTC